MAALGAIEHRKRRLRCVQATFPQVLEQRSANDRVLGRALPYPRVPWRSVVSAFISSIADHPARRIDESLPWNVKLPYSIHDSEDGSLPARIFLMAAATFGDALSKENIAVTRVCMSSLL